MKPLCTTLSDQVIILFDSSFRSDTLMNHFKQKTKCTLFKHDIYEIARRKKKFAGALLQFLRNGIQINFKTSPIQYLVNYGNQVIGFPMTNFLFDRELVMMAVKEDGGAFKYSQLKDDRELVEIAVKTCGYAILFASNNLQQDRSILLEAIKEAKRIPSNMKKKYENDKEVMAIALEGNGNNIFLAGENIRNDREMVKKAIRYKNFDVPYGFRSDVFFPSFSDDRELVLLASHVKNGLQMFNPSFRSDPIIAIEYLKHHTINMNDLDESLLNNLSFLVKAVEANPECYELVGFYQTNEQIIRKAAIGGYPRVNYLFHIKDFDFIKRVMKVNPLCLQFVHQDFKNSKDIVLEAIRSNPMSFQYASTELRGNKEVVIEALERGYVKAFNHLTDNSLYTDRDILRRAFSQYCTRKCLENAPREIFSDREFWIDLLQFGVLKYCDESLKSDKEFVLKSVSLMGVTIQDASEQLKADREVIITALSNNGNSLHFVERNLLNDREIVLAAVKNGFTKLSIIPHFSSDREIILHYSKYAQDLLNIHPSLLLEKEIIWNAILNDKRNYCM